VHCNPGCSPWHWRYVKNGDKGAEGCAGAAPGTFPYPFCYITDDGWDAMEGSVSGDGCRPTVGAMKYGDAVSTLFSPTAPPRARALWLRVELL